MIEWEPFLTMGYQLFGGIMLMAFGKDIYRAVFGLGEQSIHDKCVHRLLQGDTGTGKTTLLYNLIIKETKTHGGAFISTHGVKSLLSYFAPDQVPRVRVISPGRQRPVGINLLHRYQQKAESEAVRELERSTIADQVVSLFAKINSKSWGEVMEELVRQSILAILEAQDAGAEWLQQATLWDVYRFMYDGGFREETLDLVETTVIKDTFAQFNEASMQAAIRRMRRMLASSVLVATLSQPNGLDLKEIVDNGEILVVDVDQDEIGHETAQFIAEVIMSKFYLVAQTRKDSDFTKAFFLYYDEFQTYCNRSIAQYVSECRKRRMPITLANQYSDQLTDYMQRAVELCNTHYYFRLTLNDAKRATQAFPESEGQKFRLADLLWLGSKGPRKETGKFNFQRFNQLPDYRVIYREKRGRKHIYGVRRTRPMPRRYNLADEIWALNDTGPTRAEIIQAVEKQRRKVASWTNEPSVSFDF